MQNIFPLFFVFFFDVIKYLRIFANLKIDNTLKSLYYGSKESF